MDWFVVLQLQFRKAELMLNLTFNIDEFVKFLSFDRNTGFALKHFYVKKAPLKLR